LGDIRRRDLPFTWGRGRAYTELTNPSELQNLEWFPEDGTIAVKLSGTQVTESENHSGWQHRYHERDNIRGIYYETPDVGGDFTMKKQYVATPLLRAPSFTVVSPWSVFTGSRLRRTIYQGPVAPPGITGFPPFASSSESQMTQWGTTAISRCAPSNNVANLASTLFELRRDGIPKLLGSLAWKTRSKGARDVFQSAGSEYLNVEFGWKPLVSDVRDVAKTFIKFDELLKQYERDAGRIVRRRYSFPPIVSENSTTVSSSISALTNPNSARIYDPLLTNKGSVVRSRLTTVNRWFSGAFTYHLPTAYHSREGVLGLADQARTLLGLDLDPEVLWNIAPWSWAVDWFSSAGDVVKNLTQWSSDGLVLRYGYIMEHSIVRDTYTYVGPTGFYNPTFLRPAQMTLVSEVKMRRRATPFGFGLNLEALTSRQKAIIAALGLSRLR